MEKSYLPATQTNFLLYTAADGKVKVDVFLKDEKGDGDVGSKTTLRSSKYFGYLFLF